MLYVVGLPLLWGSLTADPVEVDPAFWAALFAVTLVQVALGGLILIWKGVKELRVKARGLEEEVRETERFVIFTLLLMFSVDLYQNWWERKVRKQDRAPIELKRRKK